MTATSFFKQRKGLKFLPEKRNTGLTIEDYFAEMEKKSLVPNVMNKRRNIFTAIPGYKAQLKPSEAQENSWIQPIINPGNKKHLRPLKFIKGNKYESREIEKIRKEQQYSNQKRPDSRNNQTTICSSLEGGTQKIETWTQERVYSKYNGKLIRRITNKW